jgi:hypothetical protein
MRVFIFSDAEGLNQFFFYPLSLLLMTTGSLKLLASQILPYDSVSIKGTTLYVKLNFFFLLQRG